MAEVPKPGRLMVPASRAGWAISFADLALLLLGFFVLLHAADRREIAAASRAAFAHQQISPHLMQADADALFEAGEARLLRSARARVEAIGAAARGRGLVVDSEGWDGSVRRFDGWELAAARAAALARALESGGVSAAVISIRMPRRDDAVQGQRLTIRFAR